MFVMLVNIFMNTLAFVDFHKNLHVFFHLYFKDLRMFESHIADVETSNARTIAQLEVRLNLKP